MNSFPQPPPGADRLLALFCAPHLLEAVQGDLQEEFALQVERLGARRARWWYWREVLGFWQPFALKRQSNEFSQPFSINSLMLRNYFKLAWRNMAKNRGFSAINLIGLSVGMAVAMIIGLWVRDELSFNRYHRNYDRIAQVMQNSTFDGGVGTQEHNPIPLGHALRANYGADFKHVLMSSGIFPMTLAVGDKTFTKTGSDFEPGVADMLTLNMLRGSRDGLREPNTILLSESVAKTFFGDANPMGKVVKVNDDKVFKVTGVYEDLPQNTAFHDMQFITPWDESAPYLKNHKDDWDYNSFRTYVQLADRTELELVSEKIRKIKWSNVPKESRKYKPEVFLHPMSKWHLYAEFENGVNVGGRIQYVWLFGLVGGFVLLLACINFMNLSTARAQKRAKEVGLRKAVGSRRAQLVGQFFSESFLVVLLAFALALILVVVALPWFSQLASKQLALPWLDAYFWSASGAFILLTGLVAGSYPALYLSGFQPVKVLKGTFSAGRFAALPRKVLVVVQFTVSVALIIGTLIVYRQIQFAQNRPMGYSRDGLVILKTPTPDVHTHVDVIRNELQKSGAIVEMAESHSPMTDLFLALAGFDWKGKDPNQHVSIGTLLVSHEFGKTVGWQFKAGRDFSKQFASDSSAIILNESFAKLTGLAIPVGEFIKLDFGNKQHSFKVIGVVRDVLMESPYKPVRPSVYLLNSDKGNFTVLKLNSAQNARASLAQAEAVFKKYAPAASFDYRFVDEEHAVKFAAEERVGKLAGVFAALAILISCLGLFGMASFVAEQRTKEIGVRKVLGASVFSLWRLLSGDFVNLVLIAFLIASPLAYYVLTNWLQRYEYRTEISWWVFAAAGVGALAITLLTVSFQSIKAALTNPVKSLRSE